MSESFLDLFSHHPDVRADAPGRVNLIGEHTDYNGGLVFPIAIPQRTRVELARHAGDRVRAWSAQAPGGPGVVEYILGQETRRGAWIDYVQGLTRVLADAGVRLGGFDLRIASDVPVGSGLSSSAALEIAVLRGLRALFGLPLEDVAMARAARQAENEFVGAPVGIMDQMAATMADDQTALFLDASTLAFERVPLPAGADLAVINSGIRHDHASGDYRVRRGECERACALLGIRQLRDLAVGDLGIASRLPPPLDRRVRHVVTENARVEAARDAMRAGNLAELGRLMNASHASMRDDYEVSVPPVDRLVESATAHPRVFGARLTGGGFGGCIVVLAERGSAASVAREVVAAARARGDAAPSLVVPPPDGPP